MFRENNLRPGDARRIEESWIKEELEKQQKSPEKSLEMLKKIFFDNYADKEIDEITDNLLAPRQIEIMYEGAKSIIKPENKEAIIELMNINRNDWQKYYDVAQKIIEKYESLIPEAIEADEREAA